MKNHIQHTPIHGDGKRPIERVLRHPHEWELTEFEWDPKSGEAVITYERTIYPEPLVRDIETATTVRSQPTGRWHAGWRMWNGRFTTVHS